MVGVQELGINGLGFNFSGFCRFQAFGAWGPVVECLS